MRKLANSELQRKSISEFQAAEKSDLIVILDNIRSLNNIGSVFRTADAFLIAKVYLCGITATPPHKDIHKTALGATDAVAWEYRPDIHSLIEELQKQKIQVWAVEQADQATLLSNFSPQKKQTYALIFGNEVKGVQQSAIDLCDGVLEIPQWGTKHSLNISVSAGVTLWDLSSKLNAHKS